VTVPPLARNLAQMEELIVIEPDKRLDTREASAFLTAIGYATAPATLNKLRCIGGGPLFEKFGRRPLYSETSLLSWVRDRTTHPLRSSSDATDLARPIQSTQRSNRQRKPEAASARQVSHDH
jgi:hypothetical protein